MRSIIVVVRMQAILFARRLSFAIYIVLTLALIVSVALTDNLSGGVGAMVVRVSNNLLFFQFPLLALLISPLVVQNQDKHKDWLWTTPLELPLLVLGQFVGIALVLCAALALNGFLMFALLTLVGTVPVDSVVSIYGYYLLLLFPVTLAAASVPISLALMVRNTYVVVAAVAGISALTWLGLLMPAATLLTPLNFTLITLDLNPVVGLGADRPLLLSLLLFYLGCVPFVLILAIFVHARLDYRTGWSPKRKYGFTILAILAFGAAGGSWQYYSVTASQRLVPPPLADQIDIWEVVDAEQDATLDKEALQVRSKMRLRNGSDGAQAVIELGLNTGMRIITAKAGGETVASQRIGEVVQLGPLPISVAAGEEIELEMLYKGVPVLLREDYQLITTIGDGTPVSFQKKYISFVNGHSLQWIRDSDWLAWPLTSDPHLANEGHRLRVSLNDSYGPFLSSGTLSEKPGGMVVNSWENPPQFLIARGAYRHSSLAEGESWIGKLSDEQTAETARRLLKLRRALGEWLEDAPQQKYQMVELPYLQNIVMGGNLLGFHNEIETRFLMFSTSETASASSFETSDTTKGVYTPEIASELSLAVEIGRAWLSDKCRWPKNETIKSGNLRSYSVTCDLPSDTESERCRLESMGDINQQAPGGRWVEESESQSNVVALLQAFAVIIAHEIAQTATENKSFLEEELAKWKGVSLLYLENQASTRSLIPPLILQARRPVGTLDKRHNCQLAHFVVSLSEFTSHLGRDALAEMIASMSQEYPPDGERLTEEAIGRILQDRFGYEWQPSSLFCEPA